MFAKVFGQIFDSSIAENYQTRHVFMDLLVLADSDGVIDMTAPAIARRTNVPLDQIQSALTELTAPDLDSRTKGEDGRRLLPIDETRGWGWQIVNYQHYRKIRDEETRREYWREHKRSEREWRLRNSVRGVGFRSRRSKSVEAEPDLPSSTADQNAPPNSAREGVGVPATGECSRWEPSDILGRIEQSLSKARQVEEEAHRLVAQAQRLRDDELIAVRISAYNKALEGRLKAEEKCVGLLEKLQVLITMDFAKQLIRKAWVPLLTRLRSIPKRAAVKANPHDDVHAETIISAEIEDAIKEAQGAFVAEPAAAPALGSGGAGEASTLT